MSCRDIILDSVLKGKGEESLLSLSKHKYASNVVEKLIQFGLCRQRELIMGELLKVSALCLTSFCSKPNPAQKSVSLFFLPGTAWSDRRLHCSGYGKRWHCKLRDQDCNWLCTCRPEEANLGWTWSQPHRAIQIPPSIIHLLQGIGFSLIGIIGVSQL